MVISRERVGSQQEGGRGEAGNRVPHETRIKGRPSKEKCPGTSHMKLTVIALRVLIVLMLQRESASD